MKVFFLNASPKEYGATQEILNIVREALPVGMQSEETCLGRERIAYCLGCKACYEGDARCVQDDGMADLLRRMNEADALVMAAPSYWADVPGQFKVFLDRCTPYSDTNPNPAHWSFNSGKKCYALALRTGQRPMECEHIIETIAHWCGHMGVEMADSLYFCKVNGKEDIAPHRQELIDAASRWFGSAK